MHYNNLATYCILLYVYIGNLQDWDWFYDIKEKKNFAGQ